jgi:hypothetical protein
MNSDESVIDSSPGDGVAFNSDWFETAELAKSRALADKQQQESAEAATRMEKRGNFTAGFL